MFISPRVAIENGWIKYRDFSDYDHWTTANFVSPNAIDFPLSKVFSIAEANAFIVAEEGKVMRGGAPFNPVTDRATGKDYWNLAGNSVWDCLSDMYVDVPDGVACMLITRSTLSRNGLFLTSGLYDSNFQGSIGCALYNNCSGIAKIGVDTRIGQIIFVESNNEGGYKGGYNHQPGSHWNTSANVTENVTPN